MSATELYVVQSNFDVESDHELRNSHGGASRIWDAIFDRHFHPKPMFGGSPATSPIFLRGLDSERFWKLSADDTIPHFARRVFAWTFDGVILPREECAQMADDLERFDAAYPRQEGCVNHLPALAAYLRTITERDVFGVAVNWTSVNADTWAQQPVTPSGEDDDDYRPYNVETDGKAWLLSKIVPATPDAGAGSVVLAVDKA